MNCKKGDLAIVVRGAFEPELIGRIFKCLSLYKSPSGFDAWRVDPAIPDYTGICDYLLMPIRDPGEDARDETLIWKSVPSSSKEHA